MPTLADGTTLYERGTTAAEALFDKVIFSILRMAEEIRTEDVVVPNHANRLVWAKEAYADPAAKAEQMWGALLGANSAVGISVAAITGAADTAIDSAVSNAVDIFADGGA